MKHRFVFDTNVLISAALLKGSVARRAFDLARSTGVILASQATLSEIAEVMGRSKFDKYLTPVARVEFLAAFVQETELMDAPETIHVCRDPKDDMILDLAVAGAADCIVSGDEDLLVLSPFQGIRVLRPAEMVVEMTA